MRKEWLFKSDSVDKNLISSLSKSLGISDILATILISRGYDTEEKAKSFIQMSKEIFHDFSDMPDIEKGVNRIIDAIKSNEKITIYGDYDADGVTSVFILYDYLVNNGALVDFYIPNRKTEGYGVSKASIEKIISGGTKLIITVDTGITACAEIVFANDNNVDVIITDHHECLDTIPSAYAVINPKRADSKYPFSPLAGVGVVYKLLCALEKSISDCSNYDAVSEISKRYLDMVSLGTIADAMPVIDENRLIASFGLKYMSETNNLGLRTLIDCINESQLPAQKPRKINSTFVSFLLAPRINAVGRIYDASIAVQLFLSKDKKEAYDFSLELMEANRIRQLEENAIFDSALSMVDNYSEDGVMVLDSVDWNYGVVGIVASRLAEKISKPVILLTFEGCEDPYNEDAVARGSGRSIEGINLIRALQETSDYMEKYGGHDLAAGISIKRKNIPSFRKKLSDFFLNQYSDNENIFKQTIDYLLNPSMISLQLAKEIKLLEPYGTANSLPQFAIKDLKIIDIYPMSNDKHQKITFSDNLIGLYFHISSKELKYSVGDIVDIIVQIDVNEFAYRENVQIVIKQMRYSSIIFDESENEEKSYKELIDVSYIEDAEAYIPSKDDYERVYRFLKNYASYSYNEKNIYLIYEKCLKSLKDISYKKFRIILDVFSENKLIDFEINEDYDAKITINHVKSKIDLDESTFVKEFRGKSKKERG